MKNNGYTLGVDNGSKCGDRSVICMVTSDNGKIKVLAVGQGEDHRAALKRIAEQAVEIGCNINNLDDISNLIDEGKNVFNLNSDGDIIKEKPMCFNKCIDQYCDMEIEHCSNRDYPVPTRCFNCNFYFGKLERLESENAMKKRTLEKDKTHKDAWDKYMVAEQALREDMK